LAELEQRAAMLADDVRLGDGSAFIDRAQHLELLARHRAPAPFPRLFRPRVAAGFFAREPQPRELADHGVAADADLGCDLATGEAGGKMDFQEIDAFGGPGRQICKHVGGPISWCAAAFPASRLVTTFRCRGSTAARP